jgi:hypothetical protein
MLATIPLTVLDSRAGGLSRAHRAASSNGSSSNSMVKPRPPVSLLALVLTELRPVFHANRRRVNCIATQAVFLNALHDWIGSCSLLIKSSVFVVKSICFIDADYASNVHDRFLPHVSNKRFERILVENHLVSVLVRMSSYQAAQTAAT